MPGTVHSGRIFLPRMFRGTNFSAADVPGALVLGGTNFCVTVHVETRSDATAVETTRRAKTKEAQAVWRRKGMRATKTSYLKPQGISIMENGRFPAFLLVRIKYLDPGYSVLRIYHPPG